MLGRRQFIQSATLIIGEVSLILSFQLTGHAQTGEIAIEKIVGEPRFAKEIGRQYLETIPAENDANVLIQFLTPSKSDIPSIEMFQQWLVKQIQKDFETDQTVLIDHWRLSKTELRLCALTNFQ